MKEKAEAAVVSDKFDELDEVEKAKIEEITASLGLPADTYSITDIILAVVRKMESLHQ